MNPSIRSECLKDQRDAARAKIERDLCDALTAPPFADWSEFQAEQARRFRRLLMFTLLLGATVAGSLVLLYFLLGG